MAFFLQITHKVREISLLSDIKLSPWILKRQLMKRGGKITGKQNIWEVAGRLLWLLKGDQRWSLTKCYGTDWQRSERKAKEQEQLQSSEASNLSWIDDCLALNWTQASHCSNRPILQWSESKYLLKFTIKGFFKHQKASALHLNKYFWEFKFTKRMIRERAWKIDAVWKKRAKSVNVGPRRTAGIAAAGLRKFIWHHCSNNHKSGNSEADTRGKSAGHQIQENKNHRVKAQLGLGSALCFQVAACIRNLSGLTCAVRWLNHWSTEIASGPDMLSGGQCLRGDDPNLLLLLSNIRVNASFSRKSV